MAGSVATLYCLIYSEPTQNITWPVLWLLCILLGLFHGYSVSGSLFCAYSVTPGQWYGSSVGCVASSVDTDRRIQWLLCVYWHDVLATLCFLPGQWYDSSVGCEASSVGYCWHWQADSVTTLCMLTWCFSYSMFFTWPVVWQQCGMWGQFCGLLLTLTGWFSDYSVYADMMF